MKNGLIPQKRITALQNLAKLISHMNNQSRIEYRTIAIEKIPLNENYLKSKGFPHSNILKKSLESICYHICEEITELPFNHISNSMRPGIYLGPDIAGTKNKSKITDWHINKENIYPHIHGLIILPFEIRKWQEKILIQKIKDKLQSLPFVENKSTLIKSNRKINLSPYKENTPLWNFTDYASKLDLKNASSNHTNSFIPVIYPYGLDVHKIRTRYSYKKNRDGYDRKLNDIYRQAATTYEKLLLEPWHFFNSDVLRDISDKHRDIIIEHKFSGESLMNSSRKNRIIYELEKDGGAYIKEQQPNHYPSQVQKLFIKPDVKEFIDELATAAVLDKAEPEPDDSLVHLVASSNPFSGYRSFTDWAKSYGTYEARYLLAQMRHHGTTDNCAA